MKALLGAVSEISTQPKKIKIKIKQIIISGYLIFHGV